MVEGRRHGGGEGMVSLNVYRSLEAHKPVRPHRSQRRLPLPLFLRLLLPFPLALDLREEVR